MTDSRTGQAGRWLALLAAVLGWMFDGFEMGLHPLVAEPALREFLQPDFPADADLKAAVTRWNATLNSLFLFGAACGGFLFGWLGDRLGRSRALLLSILTYTFLTGLGGFSQAAWQLAILRFGSALGMGGEWSLGVALVVELWPSSARPYLAGVIGAAANVGYLLVALVNLAIAKVAVAGGWVDADQVTSLWRPLMFVGVTPALLTVLIRFAVPESEKWKQAVAVQPPSLREVIGSAVGWRILLAVFIMAVPLLATWGAVQVIPRWVALLPGGKEAGAKEFAQMAGASGAVVGSFLAALAAWRFGRRPTFFALCLLSLLATGWLFSLAPREFNATFLVSVFVVGLCTASFYGWAPLYLPELFPTRIRSTGQGIAFNAGRIVAGVGTLTIANTIYAGDANQVATTLAIASLVYVVGLGLIWLAPETKGRPLPE